MCSPNADLCRRTVGRFLKARFDGEHVKSPRRIFQATRAKKLTSHASQFAAFLQVHGVFRCRRVWFCLGSRFHFYECEGRAILGHHIEFRLYFRHGEISRELFCG
jgi:hypothetical protein